MAFENLPNFYVHDVKNVKFMNKKEFCKISLAIFGDEKSTKTFFLSIRWFFFHPAWRTGRHFSILIIFSRSNDSPKILFRKDHSSNYFTRCLFFIFVAFHDKSFRKFDLQPIKFSRSHRNSSKCCLRDLVFTWRVTKEHRHQLERIYGGGSRWHW